MKLFPKLFMKSVSMKPGRLTWSRHVGENYFVFRILTPYIEGTFNNCRKLKKSLSESIFKSNSIVSF